MNTEGRERVGHIGGGGNRGVWRDSLRREDGKGRTGKPEDRAKEGTKRVRESGSHLVKLCYSGRHSIHFHSLGSFWCVCVCV